MEKRQVGLEGDACVLFFARVFRDLGLILLVHVLAEHLFVFQLMLLVSGLDDKLCGINVGEFRTEAVTTTRDFGLVIIVIR